MHCARCLGEYVSIDKEKEADRKIDVHAIFGGSRQLWPKTSKIRIEHGLLMDGIIDKSSLRSSSSSLIKCIFDNYGAQRAAQFIDECQFLANRYMLYTGYSIGIDDFVLIPRKVVKSIVDNEFLKANPLNPDVAVEDVKNKIMNMSMQQLNQNGNNGFKISVESGAKGSLFNVCQMTGLLGQQYINGKRLTDDRTQGTIFDQGFIVGSFGSGLNPKEFFSHARAGRASLCDTALSTSQTGYSQRKLIKLMEKMVFHNDGSMRCVCSGRIYEEAFGGDGIDPCRRVLDPNWLKRAIYRAQAEDCQGKT